LANILRTNLGWPLVPEDPFNTDLEITRALPVLAPIEMLTKSETHKTLIAIIIQMMSLLGDVSTIDTDDEIFTVTTRKHLICGIVKYIRE